MDNNHTLILGASSEIGQQIIRALDQPNQTTFAHYNNNPESLETLRSNLEGDLVPIRANLELNTELEDLVDAVHELCDAPERLVFLPAAKFNLVRFKDSSWSLFERDLNIQLRSAVTVLQKFLPVLAKRKRGKVVFLLSSVTINVPPGNLAHYTAVKYSMLGLMKALAAEYAAKGICLNAVSPSMTETGFLSEIPEKLVELTAASHPLKRNATTADIAPIVRYLLSDDADYINGLNIPVTGGIAF